MPGDLSPCLDAFQIDPVLWLDLSEPVRRGMGQVLDADETGALVRLPGGGQTGVYALFARTALRAVNLCRHIPRDAELVVCHETCSQPALKACLGFSDLCPCRQAGYLAKDPLPLPDTPFALRPLTMADLPRITAHYSLTGPEYLREVLARGEMTGAFLGSALAGFVGRHPDGSIGLLEVLPPYRRMGAAVLLQSYMTNQVLARGEVPYTQIFLDNEVSLHLQKKLGYTCARGLLYWGQASSSHRSHPSAIPIS